MYLQFKFRQKSSSGLTCIWEVIALDGTHTILGDVRWYAPWRKYIFAPNGTAAPIFDSECLKEIIDFLDAANEEHKNKGNV